jgi:pyruvate dehydrogenase E2 component (dihydrolipoamide acetyltransferase)
MNSLYEQNGEHEPRFKQPQGVDISVAVATDKGLITPIIKNADQLNVEQISRTLKLLAEKARAGKLQPHEFQGGTFSISNLGMFGIKEFSAVINPPQSGILAVGASRKIVTSIREESIVEVQNVCNVKLSFDQRAIEIDRAIQFLESLKFFLKYPNLLANTTMDPI